MISPENLKILVVGDIMLDKYVIGEVSRISPEAPVPIVNVSEEYCTLGGCGHVCKNLKEMGAQVDCLSSIGNDLNGDIILSELRRLNINRLIIKRSTQTTVKERIISDQRQVQMLRIDREIIKTVNADLSINILETVNVNDYNMIVISDYAKGMITHELMQYLKATNKQIIVDPKPINGQLYNGVYMITPNESEWNIMKLSSAYNLCDVSFLLITKGKNGMTLIENREGAFWDIDSNSVEIFNVSGAGDTVIAVMSVCLSMGWKELDAAYIANKCAAYVVTQPGTTAITKEKFIKFIKEYKTGLI